MPKQYVIFTGGTPYVGTDYSMGRIFNEPYTDSYLFAMADEIARDNAEGYVHLVDTDWCNSEEEEDEAVEEFFSESCGDFEVVSKEEYIATAEDYGWEDFDPIKED